MAPDGDPCPDFESLATTDWHLLVDSQDDYSLLKQGKQKLAICRSQQSVPQWPKGDRIVCFVVLRESLTFHEQPLENQSLHNECSNMQTVRNPIFNSLEMQLLAYLSSSAESEICFCIFVNYGINFRF